MNALLILLVVFGITAGLIVAIHFTAKVAANRISAFNGLSGMQERILTIAVFPVLSYLFFMTTFGVTQLLFLLVVEALHVPESPAVLNIVALVRLLGSLLISIIVLYKWLRFQADQIPTTRISHIAQIIIVALAVVGTFTYLAFIAHGHILNMSE
jgi:hypothetical protein